MSARTCATFENTRAVFDLVDSLYIDRALWEMALEFLRQVAEEIASPSRIASLTKDYCLKKLVVSSMYASKLRIESRKSVPSQLT